MKIKTLIILGLLVASTALHAAESSKQDKLKELVMLMDMQAMNDTMHTQMDALVKRKWQEVVIPPAKQEKFDEYDDKMSAVIEQNFSWERIEPLFMAIYERNFSEQEIDDMLAFYKTETGQSLLKKMPTVMMEAMQMSQQIMRESLPQIEKIREQLHTELEE